MTASLRSRAEELAQRGQLQDAKFLYAQICQLAPHQADSWLRLAQLQYDLAHPAACQQALEYVLRLDPLNADALVLGSAVLLDTGDYRRAIQLADTLLSLSRGHQQAALLNKSTALLRLNRFAEALVAADAALVLDDPQAVATIHSNRASALFGLGRHAEALAACEKALALRPDYGTVLINQAAILRALQRPTEALAAAEAALALHPQSTAALLNQAAALMDLRRPAEALTVLDRLLVLQPNHVKALQNRILALLRLGRHTDALTGLDTLQMVEQPMVELVLTAANHWLGQGQLAPALAWIDKGLSRYPDQTALLQQRIALLLAQERYPAALATAERLLPLAAGSDPLTAQLAIAAAFNANGRFQDALVLLDRVSAGAAEDWRFHAKRGEALSGLDRFTEARACFERADQLESRVFRASFYDSPFQNRPTDSRLPPVTPELVRVNFEFRRLEHGDWDDYEARISRIRRWTEECLARGKPSPLLPFRSLFLPLPSALRLAIARREAERLAGDATALRAAAAANREFDQAKSGRLKIGYVSADFRQHPTAHLMRGLFRSHERDRFEIYGYTLRPDDGSDYYRQIRDDCDHFVDLSDLDNVAAARRIQDDGVHILVDLMVYTNFARPEIFALRPAPVQVNWLGFPGSSGADYLDYLLVDPVVLPPEQMVYCAEQPVFLPECYQVNDRWQEIAETRSGRGAHGLPEQGFVFCCFNQIQKLEPYLFTVWMRVLRQTPDSVLWLYAESEEARTRLQATAATHGIAEGRLIFAGRLPKAQHLERHRLADLFLDTRIYSAHTTASDALWAGVPVLTCIGETFPARVAASLLQAIGLPELIVHSLNEYEALAVRLAQHPVELAALRERLHRNRLRLPLFDTERFARHLERAYELMWERQLQALPPAPLRVEPLPGALG